MNRKQRRAEKAKNRARENRVYETYVRHLPEVPLDQPLERGRVYHMVFHHDDWCGIHAGGECTCNPTIERRVEPVRS